MNPIGEFLIGPSYLLRGFGMLREPSLRRYIVIPIAINVALIVALLSLLGWQFDYWLDRWLTGLPDWLQWLETLLWWCALLLATLAFCYVFTLLANLIASPFNGQLSAAVEKLLTGRAPESGMGLAAEMADGVFGELRRMRWYAANAALLAIVSLVFLFVPLLNLTIAPLWFIFGAYMLSFEYLDQPMGNRGMTFADKRRHLRQRRWRHLGFGSLVTLATAVPFANLIVMPAAVVGATLLFIETADQGARPESRAAARHC